MNKIIDVKMGGLAIIDNEVDELKTFVGSCVALCLFDMRAKIAAMAHIMLPKKTTHNSTSTNDEIGKFADTAFLYMIDKMISKGADLKRIHAKIAGGAKIFSHESETSLFNVGTRNIDTIKQILKENSIPIISEDIGENFGRWVKFNLNSGKMTVISNLKKTEKSI